MKMAKGETHQQNNNVNDTTSNVHDTTSNVNDTTSNVKDTTVTNSNTNTPGGTTKAKTLTNKSDENMKSSEISGVPLIKFNWLFWKTLALNSRENLAWEFAIGYSQGSKVSLLNYSVPGSVLCNICIYGFPVSGF